MNTQATLEDTLFSPTLLYQNTLDSMFTKIRGIFSYANLPLTIPKRHLERFLTQTGFAVIYEYEGDLFATDTKPSEGRDVYGDPVVVRIDHYAETARPEQLERTIGVDAVLIRNDPDTIGLAPLIQEYSLLMAQGKVSLLRNLTNLRNPYLIQAKDENTYEAALEYEAAVRRGDISIMMSEEFDTLRGMAVHNTAPSGNPATQTIELIQYVQSMYYSELGINVNNNMKREYVSDGEQERSTGASLLEVMLESRLIGWRDVKALFDVDVEVTLSEQWNDEVEEDEALPTGGAPAEEVPAEEPTAEPAEEPEGEEEPEPEAGEEEPDVEEPEVPEAEDVSKEELIEATEALTGEEHEQETDERTAQ